MTPAYKAGQALVSVLPVIASATAAPVALWWALGDRPLAGWLLGSLVVHGWIAYVVKEVRACWPE